MFHYVSGQLLVKDDRTLKSCILTGFALLFQNTAKRFQAYMVRGPNGPNSFRSSLTITEVREA